MVVEKDFIVPDDNNTTDPVLENPSSSIETNDPEDILPSDDPKDQLP